MGTISEEKIILENDTFALKREYKYAHENLAKIKQETADILAIRDKATKEYEEKQTELTETINKISQERLDWATFRQSELAELENKQSEAQNVINWKADLNKKEEELRKLEASDVEIRNEARQLELKNNLTTLGFEDREKQIKVLHKEVDDKVEKFENDKKAYKESVIKVLEEFKTL